MYRLATLAWILVFFTACGDNAKPMDADTRQEIDSLSAQQIRQLKIELDTLCAEQRRTVLPHLVDSIKAVRLREIEEKLRGIEGAKVR